MHGYQLASAAGPLCDEPMWGIAFEVEARLNVPEGEDNPGNVNLAEEVYGPFSGQVRQSALNCALRKCVLATPGGEIQGPGKTEENRAEVFKILP